jgi:hypothetical protein
MVPGLAFASVVGLTACGSTGGPVAQDCPVYEEVASQEPTTENQTNETPTTEENPVEEQTPQEEEQEPAEEQVIPDAFEIAARLHGCQKVRYKTLGTMLNNRGVDLVTTGQTATACTTSDNCPANQQCSLQLGVCITKPALPGYLYQTATDALAVPSGDSRQQEKDGHTTASAMKFFDIFIQAAPDIIANISDPDAAPACVHNGMSSPMFDPADGSCNEEAVSCLIGVPARADHMLLCNLIVDKADPTDPVDVDIKQRIAVAALLSAAHTCE